MSRCYNTCKDLAPACFFLKFSPNFAKISLASSNHQIEGECDNHCVMWKPTNPPTDPSFCTLEIPVFTLCLASNLFLPHPPTAKIKYKRHLLKGLPCPIVTSYYYCIFCLSVFGINKVMHPWMFAIQEKKKKEVSVCYQPYKIGLFAGWSVLPKSAFTAWIFRYFQVKASDKKF